MSEQPKIEGEGCYLEHCQAARDDGERYSARENGTRKDKKKKSYVEKAKVDSTAKCVCLSACAEHELSVRVPTRIVRITFGLRAALPVGIWPRSRFGKCPKIRPHTVRLARTLFVGNPIRCIFRARDERLNG